MKIDWHDGCFLNKAMEAVMREYVVVLLTRIVHHMVSNINATGTNRNYAYMAHGAMVAFIEGNHRAIHDIAQIGRWARERNLLSEEEYKQLLNLEEDYFRQALNRTRLQTTGRDSPWHNWPTVKLPKGG